MAQLTIAFTCQTLRERFAHTRLFHSAHASTSPESSGYGPSPAEWLVCSLSRLLAMSHESNCELRHLVRERIAAHCTKGRNTKMFCVFLWLRIVENCGLCAGMYPLCIRADVGMNTLAILREADRSPCRWAKWTREQNEISACE